MKEVYNGFATTDKCSDRIGKYEIPEHWWSRKFEYPWAAQYVEASDVVIDAGCGVTHPFKYYLADTCTKVYGVDLDKNLKNDPAASQYPNLELIRSDLTQIPLPDACVTKVTCISVIEHMPARVMDKVLIEFTRLLKSGGQALITLDIPTINPHAWRKCIEDSPLTVVGAVDWDIPKNVLIEPRTLTAKRRMAFCTVLEKGK